jgi:hypothetical protein
MDLLQQAVAATGIDGGFHTLVAFPQSAANSCNPSSNSDVSSSGVSFADFQIALATLQPGGGTPTADTLLFVDSMLRGATLTPDGGSGAGTAGNDLVLLITDGVPNCNPNNPNNCTSPTANLCQCTTGSCTTMSGLCSLGCLDDSATLNAANTLFNDNIDLMILPLGADADTPQADSLFGQMKTPILRTCTTTADCATGGMCNANGFCSGSQWKFSNLADFAPAAARIQQEVQLRGRCYWQLPDSVTADRIEVDINDAQVPNTQWELRSPTVVHFKGDACNQMLNDPWLEPQVWAF